ncbi:lipopolysaccharide biosynthesis protein [Halomonas daqingensis]|uniref:Lipopolysaccharide biosynthesis protein n=1 Tax=Billgrantia desiderata TaxID=52021 RepID=A0ABS9AZ89_9GAMM|nr:Wzz/FepE/Etk N-terminal domain-containing protein [Halomonas desiderata]MCE8040698.1 lipopolysaccharide biosynthesis protein [Halomonas desiderata]MCE8045273.1 lipopolysaccharide biosynthesis protein [Halomonas desiderata]
MTTPTPPTSRQHYQDDDEISLVDLAKVLIKRWKTLLFTFLLVVGGVIAYALLQERTYQYVSIYQVAERAAGEGELAGLESPNSVIAKINNLYLGPVTRELHDSEGLERLPFDVTTSNPADTLLVRISTETSERHAELASQMHERMLERVIEDQQALYERSRARLEQQLEGAQQALSAAQEGGGQSELVAIHLERITELESRLAQLNEGHVVQVAVQSLEPAGTSRTLIVAIGLVLGAMLALMAAFFSHFASLVRASLSEEQVDS